MTIDSTKIQEEVQADEDKRRFNDAKCVFCDLSTTKKRIQHELDLINSKIVKFIQDPDKYLDDRNANFSWPATTECYLKMS